MCSSAAERWIPHDLGSGVCNVDLGFAKRFSIAEQRYFQFRRELFNAFNQLNLKPPGPGRRHAAGAAHRRAQSCLGFALAAHLINFLCSCRYSIFS
jgi:hypothetical protein